MHHSAKDLTGQRFGRLVVLEATKERSDGNIVWRCWCDCGNECFVNSSVLRRGNTRSCGCLRKEIVTTHGMSNTSIHRIWVAMIQRCDNPNDKAYKYYGGRGIKVCDRWRVFENFYEDVGDPPPGKSLDRYPDNDGNYEPTNFRWASPHEQRVNSRPSSCGPNKQRWFMAFNLDTGEWFEDNNQHTFAREHRLGSSNISACLCGRRKTHKDWTFEFLPHQKDGMD